MRPNFKTNGKTQWHKVIKENNVRIHNQKCKLNLKFKILPETIHPTILASSCIRH